MLSLQRYRQVSPLCFFEVTLMPISSVSTPVPPQVSMALQALSSTLQSEQNVANVLLGGSGAASLATNPGLGQILDLSA
jgi:hypothetical protein